MRVWICIWALGLAMSQAAWAEESLQKQLSDLKEEVQYIRDNYERSEPVDIIKPVTEFISPDGEIISAEKKASLSVAEQASLEERVTYRKLKFNRRESVNDKIDSAINAAMDGHVVVGMELSAMYENALGRGDFVDGTGVTRSANLGMGSGGASFNLSGKPMRNTLLFADFDASSGTVALGEAWVHVQGPKKVYSLQAGIVDLGGSFDTNRAANDDSSQFTHGDFVNNALLGNPGNFPGAILRADFTRAYIAVGAQNSLGATADILDNLYWIAETGIRYHFVGDLQLRIWARQQPRGSQQPDQALGLSYDHRISPKVMLFGRYGKQSYIEAYDELSDSRYALNTQDWTASGGVEFVNFIPKRIKDKAGLAYGRTDLQGGTHEQFTEAYYQAELTPNFTLGAFGKGLFSRTVPMTSDPLLIDPTLGGNPAVNDALPNAWSAGIRTVIAY